VRVPDGNHRLDHLPAGAQRIGPRSHERLDAAAAVFRRGDQQVGHLQPDEQQAEDVAVADARREHHHGGNRDDAHRRSQVRLEVDQPDDRAEDAGNRDEGIADVVDAVHAALEQRGHEQDDGDLRQLGRLDAEAAEMNPPRRAVHARTEQHRDERDAGHEEHAPDHHRLPVAAVVDPHHDRHQRQAHQRPRQLLVQEQVRIAEPVHRHDGRGAVHHHHAGADEQQRRHEEQLVRFELSRHPPDPTLDVSLKLLPVVADNLSCDPCRRTTAPRLRSPRRPRPRARPARRMGRHP
jgi:hypothetical protein